LQLEHDCSLSKIGIFSPGPGIHMQKCGQTS